ncbi:MAG: hypothetical protein AABZ74_18005 [Cyanobacteriota bacterium]
MKKVTLSLFLLFVVSACTAPVTPNNSPSASPSPGKLEEKVVTPTASTPVISGADYRSKILAYYKCYLTKNGAMSGYKTIEDAYNTYSDKVVEGVYNALVASNKVNDTGCPL